MDRMVVAVAGFGAMNVVGFGNTWSDGLALLPKKMIPLPYIVGLVDGFGCKIGVVVVAGNTVINVVGIVSVQQLFRLSPGGETFKGGGIGWVMKFGGEPIAGPNSDIAIEVSA